jgi:hypothetical protein
VITRAKLAAHLRVDDETPYLDDLIDRVTDTIQHMTGVRYMPPVELVRYHAGGGKYLFLPQEPIGTVVVEYGPAWAYNAEGTFEALGSTLAHRTRWPTGNLRVTYTAGHDVDAVPPRAQAVALMLAAHWHENRLPAGGMPGEIRDAIAALVGPVIA